jgi:multidrug transporter EmrE-like cation transporter
MNSKQNRKFSGTRAVFAAIAVATLGLSFYFSIRSFTGYIIFEETDTIGNILSLALFLAGIVGAHFMLKK